MCTNDCLIVSVALIVCAFTVVCRACDCCIVCVCVRLFECVIGWVSGRLLCVVGWLFVWLIDGVFDVLSGWALDGCSAWLVVGLVNGVCACACSFVLTVCSIVRYRVCLSVTLFDYVGV